MTFTNALESLITSRNAERAVGLTVLNDAEKRCRKLETTFPSEQSLLLSKQDGVESVLCFSYNT